MDLSRKGLLPGIILILIGLFFLLSQVGMIAENAFVLLLGVIFLSIFVIKKLVGFLIPGSILFCLGISILLSESNYMAGIPDDVLFLLFLSISFFFIHVLGFQKMGNWPLIPGFILLFISGLVFSLENPFFAEKVSMLFGIIWPILLIAIGGIILYKGISRKKL